MIGVHTDLDSYRVAIAELPARLRSGGREVLVVRGTQNWATAARRALDPSVQVVVVDRPDPTAGDVDALESAGVPVVLARSDLRADDAEDAGAVEHPSAITVQLHTPRAALGAALVDTVGWVRVLAGGALTARAASCGDGAILADLISARGCGVAIVASERFDSRGALRMRATTIGAERVEVLAVGDVVSVTRASVAGELRMPRRWETPERLALRRAIRVLDGEVSRDLEEWRQDAALAAALNPDHPSA